MGRVKAKRKGRAPRGRPKKFDEPSRAITVTLPDRVIRDLSLINKDRAVAIAEACQKSLFQHVKPITIEVLKVGPERGLILVGTSEYLPRLDCIKLVEIAPERYLITIKPRKLIASVEIALRDLLDTIPQEQERERKLVASLATVFRRTRQMKVVHKEEIVIIPHDFNVDA